MKTMLKVAIAAIVGGYLYDAFVGPKIGLPASDTLGLDDVARAATIVVLLWAIDKAF